MSASNLPESSVPNFGLPCEDCGIRVEDGNRNNPGERDVIIISIVDETSAEEHDLPSGNRTSNKSHSGPAEKLCSEKFKRKKSESYQPYNQRSIPCIYRVPEELSTLKESAYKPRVVSIGPIHSNDDRLNAMERIKLSYRDSLCCRMAGGTTYKSRTLERCLSAMVDLEASVENCYDEEVKLINEKQNSLAKMMLIDGCFILELLYRSYLVKNKLAKISNDDPVFGRPMRLLAIRHDLVLLENQIPFFVLETLFSHTVECFPNHPRNLSLTKYVLSFFGNMLSSGKDTLKKKADTTDYHILDVLHKCYLPSYDPWKGEKDDSRLLDSTKKNSRFPSASDLDLAGVKFVAGAGDDLFNVTFTKPRGPLRWFHRASFEIPALSIYDGTEPLLRNLIAFEQCCPAVPRHITSYGFFMDTLINSADDVKLLENAEVLHNHLGTSEDASDLFNNICKEVVVGRFYFAKNCDAAGNHCQEQWPRFLASLKRDYFANPWSGIAVLAAIIIFGLTIVQTVYALLTYYPNK